MHIHHPIFILCLVGLSFGLLLGAPVWAQTPLVLDSFKTSNPAYTDLSLLTSWGNNPTPTSCFKQVQKSDAYGTTYNALTLTNQALNYSGYRDSASLKAASCIDYYFPAIVRSQDTIVVEFDALWDSLSHSGQDGRLVVALMYDMDQAPPFGALIDSIDAEAPFGRPAYSFRIINRKPNTSQLNYANMQYGGGKDSLGEFEISKDSLQKKWWLPGFISGPGGIVPEGTNQYPNAPVLRYGGQTLASDSQWNHFRWVVYPKGLKLYFRHSSDPDSTEKEAMHLRNPNFGTVPDVLADLNNTYGTSVSSLPTYYNWFNHFTGLRFFQNNLKRSYLSNVKVTTTGGVQSVKAQQAPRQIPVYPNPAKHTLYLDFAETQKPRVLELFNSQGQRVRRRRLSSTNQVAIQDLPAGIYIGQCWGESRTPLGQFHFVKQ